MTVNARRPLNCCNSPTARRVSENTDDEGDHPHIHIMAWSAKPGQAYLSKDGIRKIKSALANDIFKQEMLHTYELKSSSRDELVRRAREEMKSLAQEMQTSLGSHSEVESLMMTLAAQLETVKGKKKYGYLPKAVKKTADEIVDRMEQLPVIRLLGAVDGHTG